MERKNLTGHHPYTQHYMGLTRAERGRISLPQKYAPSLLIQNQEDNPEIIYIQATLNRQQVVFMDG